MVLLCGRPRAPQKASSHTLSCPAAISAVALCRSLLSVATSAGSTGLPSAITGLLPAGNLYSAFATVYLAMAGDDMELGPSFQKHLEHTYMGQQKAAAPSQAADASVIPKLHLNHPDIRDNSLFQVEQQAFGGALPDYWFVM